MEPVMSMIMGHTQGEIFGLGQDANRTGHHAGLRHGLKTAAFVFAAASAAFVGLPLLALFISFLTGGAATASLLYAFLASALGNAPLVLGGFAALALVLALPQFLTAQAR